MLLWLKLNFAAMQWENKKKNQLTYWVPYTAHSNADGSTNEKGMWVHGIDCREHGADRWLFWRINHSGTVHIKQKSWHHFSTQWKSKPTDYYQTWVPHRDVQYIHFINCNSHMWRSNILPVVYTWKTMDIQK
jgi:hypothetical protein